MRTVDPAAAETEGFRRSGLKALGLLAVALVLAMTTWFSATAVIPQLREEWSLSSGAAAWLTIAVQLGFVMGALTSAVFNLADVFSPRWVILSGSVGAATANLGILASTGPGTAVPLRFLTGFFIAGVYPPALKLMATWFRRGRGVALGILVGALTLGSAAPHLVNGLGGLRWELVVTVASIATLVGGAIGGLAVPEGPFPFGRARFDPRVLPRVFRDRQVRLASLGYFGHMWELYAMWGWLLVFFTATIGDRVSSATIPPFATFAAIGTGALGCYVGGILGDSWGRERTTIAMMATSAACALVIGLFAQGPVWLLIALALLWGFSVVGDSAQFSTLVTEVADQSYVGTALTLQLAAGFTLTVVTIWLVPIFESAFGWRWAFAFLAPGPVLGILAMARLQRLRRVSPARPTRSAAPPMLRA